MSLLRRIWMLLTARAKLCIIVTPNPKRIKTCPRCKDWTVIYAQPCPDCGNTGEAEYNYRKNW